MASDTVLVDTGLIKAVFIVGCDGEKIRVNKNFLVFYLFLPSQSAPTQICDRN
jgi:hypothetical protein